MMEDLTALYGAMPQSKMKTQLKRVINMITGGVDLKKIIIKLNKNISDATKATNGVLNDNGVLQFWGKVYEIIRDTYTKNKEIDDDK